MFVKEGFWLLVSVQVSCHSEVKKTYSTKGLSGLKEKSKSPEPLKSLLCLLSSPFPLVCLFLFGLYLSTYPLFLFC